MQNANIPLSKLCHKWTSFVARMISCVRLFITSQLSHVGSLPLVNHWFLLIQFLVFFYYKSYVIVTVWTFLEIESFHCFVHHLYWEIGHLNWTSCNLVRGYNDLRISSEIMVTLYKKYGSSKCYCVGIKRQFAAIEIQFSNSLQWASCHGVHWFND